jgi:hypothetical protein
VEKALHPHCSKGLNCRGRIALPAPYPASAAPSIAAISRLTICVGGPVTRICQRLRSIYIGWPTSNCSKSELEVQLKTGPLAPFFFTAIVRASMRIRYWVPISRLCRGSGLPLSYAPIGLFWYGFFKVGHKRSYLDAKCAPSFAPICIFLKCHQCGSDAQFLECYSKLQFPR